MSGNSPLVVSFSSVVGRTEIIGPRVFQFLAAKHSLEKPPAISGLTFEKSTGEWLDTVSLNSGNRSIQEILHECPWIRADGEIKIWKEVRGSMIYFFPYSLNDPQLCIQVNLSSYFYDALYSDENADMEVEEDVKKGLVGLSCGLADIIRSDAFMLDFYQGGLKPLEVHDVLDRLQAPERSVRGKRPGLLTGIRNSLLTKKQIETKWGKSERVYQTITDYVVLDSI